VFYVYIVIWAELPEINLMMMMIKQSREKKQLAKKYPEDVRHTYIYTVAHA